MNKEKIFYFSAERFLIEDNKNYEDFSAIKNRKEIVNYDCGLMGGLIHFNNLKDVKENAFMNKHQQIIAVYNCSNEKIDNEMIEGFEWCGFDLCEEFTAISAITNCGDMFITVIDYDKLNRYGLIEVYEEALKT